VPPIGTVLLLVAYLSWVIGLEFVNNNIPGAQYHTSLGVRAAWLAIAQVPLLILLAGKNNLIGLASGISYERLNVLHRWVARMLFGLATLHMVNLHMAWNAYGLKDLEYSTDSCIPTGWAVYAILLWMNLSTLAPFRNFSYEFFVVQHIITFFGFIIAIMFHLPSTAFYSRVYIYIPIGLYIMDRGVRSLRYCWNNARPARATLTALPGGVTKVTIKSKAIKKWSPGAHVLLCIPKLGFGQSHPATIASTPSSHGGDMVFILKAHKGFTGSLHKSATNSTTSLLPSSKSEAPSIEASTRVALIDGPYGNSHSDFASFDSVLLVAGSTGTTFTLPILLDIAARAATTKLPLKRIVYVWVIKNTNWTSWISNELKSASDALRAAGIEFSIRVHVTCDDDFTTGDSKATDCSCACDKSLGPCCCAEVSEPDEKGVQDRIQRLDSSTASLSSSNAGTKSRVLPCAEFFSGRPDLHAMLWEILEAADGETGVGVCGPLGLNTDVRRSVVKCSDERAVNKGSGAQGIYMHSECFGW
jgi:ferric-chelate reductase